MQFLVCKVMAAVMLLWAQELIPRDKAFWASLSISVVLLGLECSLGRQLSCWVHRQSEHLAVRGSFLGFVLCRVSSKVVSAKQ